MELQAEGEAQSPTTEENEMNTTLINLGRTLAHGKGHTVELDIDATAYTGPNTDRILYGTPDNKGVRMTVTHSAIEGKMAVYAHPEDEARVRQIIADIESK